MPHHRDIDEKNRVTAEIVAISTGTVSVGNNHTVRIS